MTYLKDAIWDLERKAELELYANPVLTPILFDIPIRAYNFAGWVQANSDQSLNNSTIKSSDLASRLILIRMMQDLRACKLIAVRGYGASAAAIAASIYESFYFLTAVVGDEGVADAWLLHGQSQDDTSVATLKSKALNYAECRNKFYRSLPGIAPLDAAERIKHSAEIYTTLCAFKHVNPAVQRRLGFTITGEEGKRTANTTAVPILEGMTISAATYACQHAASYVILGAIRYGEEHAPKIENWSLLSRADRELRFLRQKVDEYLQSLKSKEES